MSTPACACIPPEGDDWKRPWPQECDYHRRMRELLLRVAIEDCTNGAVDLPDDLTEGIVEILGGPLYVMTEASRG